MASPSQVACTGAADACRACPVRARTAHTQTLGAIAAQFAHVAVWSVPVVIAGTFAVQPRGALAMRTALALTGAVGAVEAVCTFRAGGSLPVSVAGTRPMRAGFADAVLTGVTGNTVWAVAVGAHVAVGPAPCIPAHTTAVGSRDAVAVGARGTVVLTLTAVMFGVAVVAKVAGPTIVAKAHAVNAQHTGAVRAQRAVLASRPETVQTDVAEVTAPAIFTGAIPLVSVEAHAMLTLGATGAVGAKMIGKARTNGFAHGVRHEALRARQTWFVAFAGFVVILRTS